MTAREAIEYFEAIFETEVLGKTDIAAMNIAVSALREREERAMNWISVDERLPKEGERVIASDGAFAGEMYINKRGRWQRYNVNDSALMMALDILWWMPLPEPPKEEA